LHASYPRPGDPVHFRGEVYIDIRTYGPMLSARRGRFVSWVTCGGDLVALVQTAFGQALVRWSMLEGVQSPVGLQGRAPSAFAQAAAPQA
jgi:hypothetical protein